mgnify:CR=1 FL=1
MRTTKAEMAYLQGGCDYWIGRAFKDCPFTGFYQSEWEQGWIEARKQHQEFFKSLEENHV